MCQCVNKIILVGFLGDAPELKFSQQGKPVCTFSLAVNERWKDPAGSPRERVEWFQIICFARLAEVCGEYLNKGRHVYVEGRLQTRKWKGPEGEKRTAIEVVANQMQILDRAPKNGCVHFLEESDAILCCSYQVFDVWRFAKSVNQEPPSILLRWVGGFTHEIEQCLTHLGRKRITSMERSACSEHKCSAHS